ncbi:MAG: hypothetical protein ABSA84_00840 [Gammaproteobacteria bacterium]|jgi:hypothetical protein
MIGKNSLLTRIRIWKSGYFLESYYSKRFTPLNHINVTKSFLVPFPLIKGVQSNIGLVSIETREIYVSLWPEGITVFNKYKPQQNFINDINSILDKQIQYKSPDYTVDLYTLDVNNLKQKLDEYGNNRFLKKYLETNSYSGVAYDLLISGGIKNLVPTTSLVREHMVAVPNNLVLFVLEAHSNEQAILRATDNFNDNTNKPSNKP